MIYKKQVLYKIFGISKVIFAFLISLVILSVFTYIYGYVGIHITNKSKSTDYIWRPNEVKTTMTEGFAWLKMDENGYNNVIIFNDIDNLLIGSSHMEATQMPYKDSVAGLLNEMCDGNTYNIGISGHTIYRCVDNFVNAIDEFHPSKSVIIETSSVKLSIDEMRNVLDGKAKRNTSYDSGIIYYAQLIPAFRPIYRQIDEWITEKSSEGGYSTHKTEETVLPDGYEETLYSFLSVVSSSASKNDITPIIFYHPTESINLDGSVVYQTEQDYLACFASTCEKLGIIFVDMTDTFEEMYTLEHRLAHGFTNTAVGEGHLNRYGHQAIAKKLSKVIKAEETE